MKVTMSHPSEIDEAHPCVVNIGDQVTLTGKWGSGIAEVTLSETDTMLTTLTWKDVQELIHCLNILSHVVTR